MQDFRKLIVWQRAHEVALGTYRITARFPQDEKYELTRQMRRAAVSIPANIAEGCGRSSSRDMARFLDISIGSACELEYFGILGADLGLLDDSATSELLAGTREVKKMLASLSTKLRTEN